MNIKSEPQENMPRVIKAIHNLESSTLVLHSVLATLQSRLEPVLIPAVPSLETDDERIASSIPLEARINHSLESVEIAISIIQNVLNRIEI